MAVEAFLDRPSDLLSRHPNDQRGLSAEVDTLALASPQALSALLRLARTALPDQRQAIGYGLGRVSAYCESRDASVSRRITEAVTALGNRDVAFAYRLAREGINGESPSLKSVDPSALNPDIAAGSQNPLTRATDGALPARPETDNGKGGFIGRVRPDTTLDRPDFKLPDQTVR
ncbi:hypothetical protein ACLBWX_20935 [Methylobacterium sp. M6A4_1b]